MQTNRFKEARQTNLPYLINGMGIKLKPQKNGFGSNVCPNCGKHGEHSNAVSIFLCDGEWKWKCFACRAPVSSAIDYVMGVNGITANEAIDLIVGKDWKAFHIPISTGKQEKNEQETEAALAKIIANATENHSVIMEYLGQRKIAADVITEAIRRKFVLCLPNEPWEAQNWLQNLLTKEIMIQAGLMAKDKKLSGIAYHPIIFPKGKAAEFRIAHEAKDGEIKAITYGSSKQPFWWAGDYKYVFVTEGAIDMLSIISMGWKYHIMGLPSATIWKLEWFLAVLKKYPETRFVLGLDNDKAGQEASSHIAATLTEHAINFSTRTPKEPHKDWNDVLKNG